MIPIEKVKLIVTTYEELEKELASTEIDKKDFVKKSKGYASIGEIIVHATRLRLNTDTETAIDGPHSTKRSLLLYNIQLNTATNAR